GQEALSLHCRAPGQAVPMVNGRDMQDIIGQQQGKRALEIAAAGGHNLLFVGPPGTGKTMLASRLCDLLPEMDVEEALETAAITSLT
ncbi:ATP-binding protein, partial [Halomonas sp. SIMBA_159]